MQRKRFIKLIAVVAAAACVLSGCTMPSLSDAVKDPGKAAEKAVNGIVEDGKQSAKDAADGIKKELEKQTKKSKTADKTAASSDSKDAKTVSTDNKGNEKDKGGTAKTASGIPDYSGKQTIELNDNEPEFKKSEYTDLAFENYADLDSLGRCGVAYANICKELMPTEKRGEIGMVKPSGWHTVKYDWVDGKYLYNRCHLIGYQLAGENANEKNLVTGTRSFNAGSNGMLPYENLVADYVKRTGHHVLYRVTPVFEGNNLVCKGVKMEGASVEDKKIRFNIFVYNIEKGVTIDYATGDSYAAGSLGTSTGTSDQSNETGTYIVNLSSKKFHRPSCEHAQEISQKNRKQYKGKRSQLINNGYKPCGSCKP